MLVWAFAGYINRLLGQYVRRESDRAYAVFYQGDFLFDFHAKAGAEIIKILER